MGNYLSDGINQGFAIGSAAREKKKDRAQRDAEREADKALRLELDTKLTNREKELQGERLAADAARQFNQQQWGTRERLGTQDFQGGENKAERGQRENLTLAGFANSNVQSEAERALRRDLQDKQITAQAKLAADEVPFKQANVAIGMSQVANQNDRNSAPRMTEEYDDQGNVISRKVTRPFDPSIGVTPAAKPTKPTVGKNGYAPGTIAEQDGKKFRYDGKQWLNY